MEESLSILIKNHVIIQVQVEKWHNVATLNINVNRFQH